MRSDTREQVNVFKWRLSLPSRDFPDVLPRQTVMLLDCCRQRESIQLGSHTEGNQCHAGDVDFVSIPYSQGTEQLEMGDSVVLRRDVYTKEGLAFNKGEIVTVVQTAITKGDKQVRYVVYSSKLGTRMAVSDEVLRKVPGVQSPEGNAKASSIAQGISGDREKDTISPVAPCAIAHDITIGGKVAFRAGEQVKVERIVPHPQLSDNKYVVLSNAMQQRFQLKAEDLRKTITPFAQ